MIKYIIIVIICCLTPILQAQDPSEAEQELVKLYTEALERWKQSNQVQDLIQKNPELKNLVQQIKIDSNIESVGVKMNFLSFFEGELKESQLNIIKEFLDPKNLAFIESTYWSIINSPHSKEIGEGVVDYMQKIRGDLEAQIKTLPKKH